MKKNNAFVACQEDLSVECWSAIRKYYDGWRIDGYQQFHVDQEENYGSDEYNVVNEELMKIGFTKNSLVLINNSW